MIVNHLKSQGLFDQFRRDCLADVDTKPAYQNLRQRVDNFVANHLATHTWSPHLNKNQLRNNIRQQVLKSGMLESGIDRIISQVVDPKINHTFRPQVEKAVHEFLATLSHKEEAGGSAAPEEEKPDSALSTQGAPAPGPSASVANDAMSILETITSLNQEATAARASTETPNAKTSERASKKPPSQPGTEASGEKERTPEDVGDKDRAAPDSAGDGQEAAPGSEESSDLPCAGEEGKSHAKEKESSGSAPPSKDVQQESSDQKAKAADKGEKKPDSGEKGERKKEKKEKPEKKPDPSKRTEDTPKAKDDRPAKDKESECARGPAERSGRARALEGAEEDCSAIDSDVDGLTDITVSSVHTSDLSSFEEDSEEEEVASESVEEGEITPDDEEKTTQNKTKTQTSDPGEGKAKSVRQAYVHKPYLYSKYYSDSDDELTVEQRRQSIAKEKEERLLRRRINREKLEEKRKQKAEKTKSSKARSQGKNSMELEESSTKSLEPKAPRIKEVLKERKVLEKKVALSKKRKKDSRTVEENSKKKQPAEEDPKEALKTSEHGEREKVTSSKDLKHVHAKSEASKPTRRLSECLHSADENRSEPRMEREHKRRTSAPVMAEGAQEEADARDGKRQAERSETGTEEPPRQKGALRNEKHVKKEDSETPHVKTLPKKETKPSKEKPEKERTLSEDKSSVKHKHRGDSAHKTGDEAEPHSSEKGLKADESAQKQSQQTRLPADDKAERKSKHRSERKLSILGKDGKPVSEYIIKTDENARKENNKKERHLSTEKNKTEHRSRRSGDSKIHKGPPSSRQHGNPLQRGSESSSEGKGDADAAAVDGSAKPEEAAPKDKRRTKSLTDERLVFKCKSKSQSKQLKVVEIDLQEGVTKQTTASKPDKERNTEESDPERQRKPKAEDRSEEAGGEPAADSAAPSAPSAQKDASHRAKLLGAKDKHRGEKEPSSSRLERKPSDGHKSRSLKHSSKDVKKKEESKSDDRDAKEADGNHEKARVVEKKLSRRLCENRRSSSSQEMTKGEERLAANALGSPSSSSVQRPKRGGDTASVPEQEPMETDPEPAVGNAPEASRAQESSSSPQHDVDPENATKQKATAPALKDEFRTSTVDAKSAAAAYKLGRGAGGAGNSEKHADHKSSVTKKAHVQGAASKPSPREKEPPQQGGRGANAEPDAGHRVLPRAPAEHDRAPKSVKHARPAEEGTAQGGALPEHSTSPHPSPSLSSVTVLPQKLSREAGVVPAGDRRAVPEGGSGSACLGAHSELPNQGVTVRESEVPRTSLSKDGGALSTADTPAKASLDSKTHIPEGSQAAPLHSKQGKAEVRPGSKVTGSLVGHENLNREGGLMDLPGRESDRGTGPASKLTAPPAGEGGRQDGLAVDRGVGVGVSARKDAAPAERKQSGGPGEVERPSSAGGRGKEESEADTSARGGAGLSVSHQRPGGAEGVTAGPGRAEAASPATSTEGQDRGTSNPVKAGAATTTSSEAGDGEVALPCTSIEADEGLTVGSGGGPVLAAAEEGGAVVTEGLAESETFLTSTKEGESGECALAGSEGRATGPAAAQGATADGGVNSAAAEEKDDAVTSAGSEGKCAGSSRRDSGSVGRPVAFTAEGESDGAVTSAGTEMREGPLNRAEYGPQGSVMRAGPRRETEGTVTCTGAARGGESLAMSSAAGAAPPEGRVVAGAALVPGDGGPPPATSAAREGDGSVSDGAEGESAVTSTGITEDAEGPAGCLGSEESGEGFAISSESAENGQSATDSAAAKEAANVPLVAAGPGDDEDIVTSTGAKEEDEEGEGVVTSTGSGNGLGHASAGPGMEEERDGGPPCESAGGDGPVGTAAGHAAAEAGAAVLHAPESNVDSVSGADKEGKDAEICSSAKGVVGSSVTSAAPGTGAAAPGPAGREGPTARAASGQSDGQLARKDRVEDAISTGLVGGSHQGPLSGVPEYEAHPPSPGERGDEGAITSVESEECDGLGAAAAGDVLASQAGFPGGQRQGAGLVISTSTAREGPAQLSARRAVEGHPRALSAEEDVEGARARTGECEAPMPSAVAGDGSQLGAARHEEKDECSMISTSIGEELEVPVSSATTLLCQQPVAAVEGSAKGPVSVSTEDFEVPMPSAPAEGGSPRASTSKEERDECALISTSVAEGGEAAISGAVAGREGEQPAAVVEERDGSAVISTSSGEDFEGPVSSAAPQEEARPSATAAEEISDTTLISTSTSEGREAVMRGAVPQNEARPVVARTEDLSEAAVISTSTAECVLAVPGLDRHEETPPAAGNPEGTGDLSAAKVSKCEVPMPSLIAENCPCPGPLPGGGGVSTEEGCAGRPASVLSAGGGQLDEKSLPGSPEAGTAGDGTTASHSAGRDSENSAGSPASLQRPELAPGQVAEGSSASPPALTAVDTGAKAASHVPGVRDTAAEQASLPPAQREPGGNLKPTTAECIHGQGPDIAPSHSVLPAACGVAGPATICKQDLTVRSDHSGKWSAQVSAERTGDGVVKSSQKEGDLAVTVSSEENLGDTGSKEFPSDASGGLDLEAGVAPETLVPAEEKNPEIPAPSESPGGGKLTGMELSSGREDNTEAARGPSVEADPKEVEEKERHAPQRRRKKHCPSSGDELDDNSDAPDSKIEMAQRQRPETELQDAKEESPGDLEESSKSSPSTSRAASGAMEDRDEYSSGEAAGEKTEPNDEDSKSQEEDQPVIIKRKRGRPRKHPVETASKTKEDCKAETSIVSVEQSPPGGKLKAVPADEPSREAGALQERSGSNGDGEEKAAGARRRGRRPKRSLTADDADSSEPERRRRRSASEAAEERREAASEEDSEEEEPAGATTRAASSRSEAQRSKAQLSPSTKRKREASPPGARTRGQQRVEEAPPKKAKR